MRDNRAERYLHTEVNYTTSGFIVNHAVWDNCVMNERKRTFPCWLAYAEQQSGETNRVIITLFHAMFREQRAKNTTPVVSTHTHTHTHTQAPTLK